MEGQRERERGERPLALVNLREEAPHVTLVPARQPHITCPLTQTTNQKRKFAPLLIPERRLRDDEILPPEFLNSNRFKQKFNQTTPPPHTPHLYPPLLPPSTTFVFFISLSLPSRRSTKVSSRTEQNKQNKIRDNLNKPLSPPRPSLKKRIINK